MKSAQIRVHPCPNCDGGGSHCLAPKVMAASIFADPICRLWTVDFPPLPESGLRPHHRGSNGREHLLSLEIGGRWVLAGDHGLALFLTSALVYVEELVEEIRRNVLGLVIDGAGVLRRGEAGVVAIGCDDFLVELVADGSAETLEQSESS